MPVIATAVDPSLGPAEGHCHAPVTHVLQEAGIGGQFKVYVGVSPIVVLNEAYSPTTCGDTAHVPLVLQGSPNVFIGTETNAVARLGDPLSCGDKVGANPLNNVFAN